VILTNHSPRGDLEVPLIRKTVKVGDEFECSEAHARRLLAQPRNFAPVDDEAKALFDAEFKCSECGRVLQEFTSDDPCEGHEPEPEEPAEPGDTTSAPEQTPVDTTKPRGTRSKGAGK
jgi:hypothetical protein